MSDEERSTGDGTAGRAARLATIVALGFPAGGVLAVVALYALLALDSPLKARHSIIAADVRHVEVLANEYAQGHDGTFPSSARWQATLFPHGVQAEAQGDKLALRERFTTVSGSGLATAVAIAHGGHPSPLGAPYTLGTTAMPGFGILVYDVDAPTGTYVIYGIGTRDRLPVVVAVATNAEPSPAP